MMSPESPNVPDPRRTSGDPTSGEQASGRTEFDWPAYAGVTEEVLRGLDRRARLRRQQRAVIGGAIVAAVILGFAWLRPPAAPDMQMGTESAVSTVVEHRVPRQVLPDGSVVDLREGAEISVDFSESFRRVTLQKGAAHFAVAKHPARPFIVKAGDVEVRAVGTEFVVDFAPASVEVLVTEGRVAVETSAGRAPAPLLLADLSAGRRVSVTPDSSGAKPVVEALSAQDLSDRLSWRVPLLRFAGTPLAEVAAQFNRHNPVPLILAHNDLAGLQLSGSLRADRLEALISILESDFGLRVERNADRIVVHRAR